MNKLKTAYFGSPDFSAAFLEKLLTDKNILQLIELKLVVTQPDKPTGRKQILTSTPVKQVAKKNGVEILEIEKFRIENSSKIENLKEKIKGVDIGLVFAYLGFIPQNLLNIPTYGFWCIHPSLLPKYRGASPIATALINGDRETGVTIIKMDEKIDHGPIIAQKKYRILSTDKRPDLEKKLSALAFDMFKKLASTNLNQLKLTAQSDSLATYTKKLAKQDGFIDFEKLKTSVRREKLPLSDVIFYNLFRGLFPWPGIWTILPSGKRLKITDMKMENGKLRINRVQLEGKKEVDFETFNKTFVFF